jgi:quercetin dioxygenase-like cupin family protein
MKMPPLPMAVTNWPEIPATQHPGDSGVALWRTRNFGDVRVRMVEYSPGYKADHWCSKGHVLLCLDGLLKIEIQNGGTLELQAGQSYHVGDGDPPHRSHTADGAKLFIVD